MWLLRSKQDPSFPVLLSLAVLRRSSIGVLSAGVFTSLPCKIAGPKRVRIIVLIGVSGSISRESMQHTSVAVLNHWHLF